MTASVPSSTALATSAASARVGRGLRIMESSICVAVMTSFPRQFELANDALLDERDLLGAQLHAEVAARHHRAVGHIENRFQLCHGSGFSIFAITGTPWASAWASPHVLGVATNERAR